MNKENANRDIDLQKIQILCDDFHARFDIGASLWVGGLIGLLISILSIYYNEQFSSDIGVNFNNTILAIVIVYAMFAVSAIGLLIRPKHKFLAYVDTLIVKVEKGESLPSLMELKKRRQQSVMTT